MNTPEEFQATLTKYAPFAAIIGEDAHKPDSYVLINDKLEVIFETKSVWNKAKTDYSKEVKAANKKFSYKQELSSFNFSVSDTLEHAKLVIGYKAKYYKI